MSEREDLEVQRRARPECRAKRWEQRDDDGGHSSRLFKTIRNINGWNAYRVSDTDTFAPVDFSSVIGSEVEQRDGGAAAGGRRSRGSHARVRTELQCGRGALHPIDQDGVPRSRGAVGRMAPSGSWSETSWNTITPNGITNVLGTS